MGDPRTKSSKGTSVKLANSEWLTHSLTDWLTHITSWASGDAKKVSGKGVNPPPCFHDWVFFENFCYLAIANLTIPGDIEVFRRPKKTFRSSSLTMVSALFPELIKISWLHTQLYTLYTHTIIISWVHTEKKKRFPVLFWEVPSDTSASWLNVCDEAVVTLKIVIQTRSLWKWKYERESVKVKCLR